MGAEQKDGRIGVFAIWGLLILSSCSPMQSRTPSSPQNSTQDIAIATEKKAPDFEQTPINDLVGENSDQFELIPCPTTLPDQATKLERSSRLDPQCVYPLGFEISNSNVTLDCRGARIVAGPGVEDKGLVISAKNGVDLHNVTIRNCWVKGFANNLRITRGKEVKGQAAGQEPTNQMSQILVENSRFYHSDHTGIFIDAFVTGVTLRKIEVAGSGALGIYLEAGSKGTLIEDSHIHSNGYVQVRDNHRAKVWGWIDVKYKMTGREGIAIDGSRENIIRRNLIEKNADGGIFLYKNCGEDKSEKNWWHRWTGADDNLIADNQIRDVRTGIWVASRQSQNQHFMDCSDKAYMKDTRFKIHLDQARRNRIENNIIKGVKFGLRIEDDETLVKGNRFEVRKPQQVAVILGTHYRGKELKRPVTGTHILDNQVDDLVGTSSGFRQPLFQRHHQIENTLFEHNSINGEPAALTKWEPPRLEPFLFVKTYEVDWWPF